jgi:SAM-dependent methyltransferase
LPANNVKRVLDYGCGGMPYRPLIEERWPGISYDGADLSRNTMANVLISEDGTVSAQNDSYDLIVSTQVLEHVTSPPLYLREAKRLLRTGGHLLLSTHGYWMYHPDPTDYWRWTGEGLRKLITEAGFVVQDTLGVGNLAAAGVQLVQDAISARVPGLVRPLYLFMAQRAARLANATLGGDSKFDAAIFLVSAFKGA